MKNKLMFFVLTVLFYFSVSGCVAEASFSEDAEPYIFVHAMYEAKEGDTLDSIAEQYIKLNTYGIREFGEFREGIKELNPWLLQRDVVQGDILYINYWKTREGNQ